MAGAAMAQQVSLKPVPTGAMRIVGFYMPQRIELSDVKPAGLKAQPAGLQAPQYGVIKLQDKSFTVIVDRPDAGPTKFYVDTNGDSDLTNDPAVDVKAQPYKIQTTEYHLTSGSPQVEIKLNGKLTPVGLGMYIFDKNDSARSQLKNTLLYYPDYGLSGNMAIGGKNYKIMVMDEAASGYFSGGNPLKEGPPSSLLLIDRRGDGNFGIRQDQYDPSKPFNIGGTTYEARIAKDGSSLNLVKSSQTVAEIPLPANLTRGQKAIAFKASTTGGKQVSFPSAYKGKVVLLDFWATWCGPCMGEVPNVVATYNKYHGKGFEILGISLDNKDTAKNVAKVTGEKGMTWDQVCDQNYWQAAVAKLYNVEAIPQAYLVDGDTGQILAEGDAIRGEALGKAVEAALGSKASAGKP
ncbi:MAG TPA: TlpA disulfide reductase family protein [Fimbriimonas sp.]|nr:TlpA disulfide reductase family protein [Fimbriimonas sp.]